MSDTRIKSNIKKQERNSYTPVLISFRDKPLKDIKTGV